MAHHTINPLLPESFDLGTDVNKDKDKGELYIDFVKKIISYLESKGKTVMMWNDIVLKHVDRLPELSENIIFGSWYAKKTGI